MCLHNVGENEDTRFVIQRKVRPGKFCNRLLTEILTEVAINHSLSEFNQLFNR